MKKVLFLLGVIFATSSIASSDYYIGLGIGEGNFELIATDNRGGNLSEENDVALSLNAGFITSNTHKFDVAITTFDTQDNKYMEELSIGYDYLFTNNNFQPYLGAKVILNQYEEDAYFDYLGNEWKGMDLTTIFFNIDIGFKYNLSKTFFITCDYETNITSSSSGGDTIYIDNVHSVTNNVHLEMDTVDKIMARLNYRF